MKKLTKLLAAMMVACLTMAGCAGGGGTDQKDQAVPQDVLIVNVTGDPQSFNPI